MNTDSFRRSPPSCPQSHRDGISSLSLSAGLPFRPWSAPTSRHAMIHHVRPAQDQTARKSVLIMSRRLGWNRDFREFYPHTHFSSQHTTTRNVQFSLEAQAPALTLTCHRRREAADAAVAGAGPAPESRSGLSPVAAARWAAVQLQRRSTTVVRRSRISLGGSATREPACPDPDFVTAPIWAWLTSCLR